MSKRFNIIVWGMVCFLAFEAPAILAETRTTPISNIINQLEGPEPLDANTVANIKMQLEKLPQAELETPVPALNNHTIVHAAVIYGDSDILNYILAKKPRIDIPDIKGETPFLLAAEKAFQKIVEALINYAESEGIANKILNQQDNQGDSALHLVAKADADQDQIQDVVEKIVEFSEADPNIKDKLGRTPLHAAAEERLPEVVQALADAGANLDIQDMVGKTALYRAIENWDPDVAQTLINAGANLSVPESNNGDVAIHVAARNGDMEILKEIVAANPDSVNSLNRQGETPIFGAIRQGHVDVVNFLLDHNARTDVLSSGNNLPFHVAVRQWNEDEKGQDLTAEMTQVFIDHNVPANQPNAGRRGLLPIHMAALEGTVGAVKLLIAYMQSKGLDITTPNAMGNSARVAAENKLANLEEGLRNLMLLSKKDPESIREQKADIAERQAIIQVLLAAEPAKPVPQIAPRRGARGAPAARVPATRRGQPAITVTIPVQPIAPALPPRTRNIPPKVFPAEKEKQITPRARTTPDISGPTVRAIRRQVR